MNISPGSLADIPILLISPGNAYHTSLNEDRLMVQMVVYKEVVLPAYFVSSNESV